MVSSTHSPIQSYYQKDSLLLQFIFGELILVQQEIQKIDSFQIPTQGIDSHWIESLQASIKKLVGNTQGYMRLFSWNGDGILTKLRNFCALLSQNNETPGKERLGMYHAANQAWLSSLQLLDCMRNLYPGDNTQELMDKLNSIKRCINRLSNCSLRVIEQFRRDENVLFFILRHKEKLEDVYGVDFVVKLMRKLFGRKLEQARNFIMEKYDQRGFNHLIPAIHEMFSSLVP